MLNFSNIELALANEVKVIHNHETFRNFQLVEDLYDSQLIDFDSLVDNTLLHLYEYDTANNIPYFERIQLQGVNCIKPTYQTLSIRIKDYDIAYHNSNDIVRYPLEHYISIIKNSTKIFDNNNNEIQGLILNPKFFAERDFSHSFINIKIGFSLMLYAKKYNYYERRYSTYEDENNFGFRNNRFGPYY